MVIKIMISMVIMDMVMVMVMDMVMVMVMVVVMVISLFLSFHQTTDDMVLLLILNGGPIEEIREA